MIHMPGYFSLVPSSLYEDSLSVYCKFGLPGTCCSLILFTNLNWISPRIVDTGISPFLISSIAYCSRLTICFMSLKSKSKFSWTAFSLISWLYISASSSASFSPITLLVIYSAFIGSFFTYFCNRAVNSSFEIFWSLLWSNIASRIRKIWLLTLMSNSLNIWASSSMSIEPSWSVSNLSKSDSIVCPGRFEMYVAMC